MTEITTVKQRFGIIGNSPLLDRALEVALRVAPTDLTVLVTGESGVGKEFFPQVIHAYSARKHSKYIAVNCAAIPEGTIDSELFGHEKGSFTGAVEARKGYFEEADGGTIFLDEVAELPHPTQARLLRVLQTGEYIRVGSSKVQKTNVRVVAATNMNLQEAIAQGRFREDLYYRLGTVPITVPSLRERPEDIPLLFRKFAADVAVQYRMPAVTLDPAAREMLMHYYCLPNYLHYHMLPMIKSSPLLTLLQAFSFSLKYLLYLPFILLFCSQISFNQPFVFDQYTCISTNIDLAQFKYISIIRDFQCL